MDNFNFTIAKTKGKNTQSLDTIQTNKFSISINGKVLFDNSDISLSINHIYGLIGKNGSGKTTLINHINSRKIPVDDRLFMLHLEQILIESNDNPVEILLQSDGPYFKHIKRMETIENLMNENESDELYEEYQKLEEIIQNRDFNIEKEESKIKKILIGLGFDEITMKQSFSLFSGGWKMRISLAKALYLDPDILLLDEPTNHLDLDAVLWLSKYLEENSSNKIVLVVSHNIGFLNRVCTNILNIENYQLVNYSGNYNAFKNTIQKKIINQEKEWNKIKKSLNAKRKVPLKKKEKEDLIKKAELMRPQKPYDVKILLQNNPVNVNGNYISFNDVSFSIEDKKLFENINFGFDCNSRICLIGKNGIGKSSFFKLIMGEYKCDSGNIYVNPSIKIGYFNQHFEKLLDENLTPIEFLENNVPDNLLTSNKKQTVQKYLGSLKLEPKFHNNKIETLSGGQKARVAFVYLIFQQPNFLLLDEPTNHLDIETIEALIEALNEFEGGFIIISHELEFIDCIEPQILEIKSKNLHVIESDCFAIG